MIGGIGLLLYLVLRKGRRILPLNDELNVTWTSIVGIYWHAMDGIWIWLFLLLLIFK